LNLASDTLKASISQDFTISHHTDEWIVFPAGKLNVIVFNEKMSFILNDLLNQSWWLG